MSLLHDRAFPPWRDRKTTYLEHVRTSDGKATRVAPADILDNARAILRDYQRIGDQPWLRFNKGKKDQLWYYRSLVSAFREAGAVGFLIDELEDVVTQLERATGH